MPSDDKKYMDLEDPSIVHEEILVPSNIENIDMALYEFLDKGLNVFCSTNKGFKKVPVVWVGAERSYQIKHDQTIRDKNGSIILPAITVERQSITKDLGRKGGVFGNAMIANNFGPEAKEGGVITIARRIKQDKTQNFANADANRLRKQTNYPRKNKKVVYETVTIPLPIYVEVQYKIGISTEYQQQLNEIIAPFISIGKGINYFGLRRKGHTYEGFVQSDFSLESNIASLGEEERKYETSIQVKVLGYLIGDDKNQVQPKLVYRQNFVDVKIGRERVIVGEIPTLDSPNKVKFRD